jgi:hypothetical protein
MVCLVATIACSGSINQYHPSEMAPKMIYIGDDLEHIKTARDLVDENRIYTEIRTKSGAKESGMLVRITDHDLILSEGYHYTMVDESMNRVENYKNIPKDEVLIMKVW